MNKEQIKGTMESWLNYLKMKDVKIIIEERRPKHVNSRSSIVAKYADFYTVYEAENEDGEKNIFFIVEAGKFDKSYLMSLINYQSLLKEYDPKDNQLINNDKVASSEGNINHQEYPRIWICPSFMINSTIRMNHIPTIFPRHKYRLIPLIDVYVRLHIKPYEWGLTSNVRLIKKGSEKWKEITSLLPKKIGVSESLQVSFAAILDSDIDARIVNGMIGDLILCDRLIYDTSPFKETVIREIVETEKEYPEQYTSGITN
jgi:hypothetical protein